MEISGRNALVTGGAHRVGRALSLALAGAGANVFVHYGSSSAEAEQTAADIEALGVSAAIGPADLRNPATGPDLIARAADAMGPISILVNSASGFPEDTLADVTIEAARRTIDLSLFSPVFLSQAFAAALPSDETGAIVNITDWKTQRPYRRHFSYMLAKAGIDAFTRVAALELAPRIRVNAIALGVILPPPGEGQDYVEKLAAELPLARVGGTEPVTRALLYLLESDFVTGEIVGVTGGAPLV